MNTTEAIAAGYTVDDHCNPPVAYKGPRFEPSELIELERDFTDEEFRNEVARRLTLTPCHVVGLHNHPAGFDGVCREQIDEALKRLVGIDYIDLLKVAPRGLHDDCLWCNTKTDPRFQKETDDSAAWANWARVER